jgi:hypothetical protein
MNEESEPLKCIVCDKQLEPVGGGAVNQPYGGTVFTSNGHYGSTVFDPMDGVTFLEITVCDDCLKDKGVLGQVLQGERPYPKPQDTTYMFWRKP